MDTETNPAERCTASSGNSVHISQTLVTRTRNGGRSIFSTPFAFARTLGKIGFNSKVLMGDYNKLQHNFLKRVTARKLNRCMKMLKKVGISIAPYYVIVSSRNQRNS